MARRSFGRLKKVTRSYGSAYVARYSTPPAALAENPSLPKEFTRTLPAAYRVELEAWLAQAEKEIALGTWTPPAKINRHEIDKSSITFAQLADDYMQNQRKPDGSKLEETTQSHKEGRLRNYLLPSFGERRIKTITSKDIQNWYDAFDCDELTGRNTVARSHCYTLLRSIFNYACAKEVNATGETLLQRNPCTLKLKKPRTRHESIAISIAQLVDIYSMMAPHLRIGVMLAGACGLREGECCALTRSDVDLNAMTISVNKSLKSINHLGQKRRLEVGKPKTASSIRKVPIPEWTREYFEMHMRQQMPSGKPDELILHTRTPRAFVAPASLRESFNRAIAHMPSLKDMHFHDLRHTALTHYGEAGASLAELMEVAGHSDIKTVSVYQQISQEQRKRTSARLNKQAKEEQLGIKQQSVETQKTVEPTQSNVGPTQNQEKDPLIAVLAALTLDQQVTTLKAIDKTRQATIISQMPPENQIQLLSRLL